MLYKKYGTEFFISIFLRAQKSVLSRLGSFERYRSYICNETRFDNFLFVSGKLTGIKEWMHQFPNCSYFVRLDLDHKTSLRQLCELDWIETLVFPRTKFGQKAEWNSENGKKNDIFESAYAASLTEQPSELAQPRTVMPQPTDQQRAKWQMDEVFLIGKL